MIGYRPFLNSDPPRLAELWGAVVGPRSMVQPLSATQLVETVLAKMYFDRQGLIVAQDADRVLGFVHAGFAPRDDGSELNFTQGIVCALIVPPGPSAAEVQRGLLAAAERYLTGRGARHIDGGGSRSLSPFYLGLLGGSRQFGISDEEASTQQALLDSGFVVRDQYIVRQRDLDGFRPPVNRKLLQARRMATIELEVDPPPANWYEAVTLCDRERLRFKAILRDSGQNCATVDFWNLDPLSRRWGVPAMGLLNLWVDPAQRRKGLATALLCEAFKELETRCFSRIEVQAFASDASAQALFESVGLEEVDRGKMFVKTCT